LSAQAARAARWQPGRQREGFRCSADRAVGNARRATVRIRVTDPEVLAAVFAHFEQSGFSVRIGGEPGVLDVRHPEAKTPEQERRIVEIHLNIWQKMYPGHRVELLDDESPSG
jgi:hypothetical protein